MVEQSDDVPALYSLRQSWNCVEVCVNVILDVFLLIWLSGINRIPGGSAQIHSQKTEKHFCGRAEERKTSGEHRNIWKVRSRSSDHCRSTWS
jgi:hypothetical protein